MFQYLYAGCLMLILTTLLMLTGLRMLARSAVIHLDRATGGDR
jgi:thiosulfate reductase cytochrome b subunit